MTLSVKGCLTCEYLCGKPACQLLVELDAKHRLSARDAAVKHVGFRQCAANTLQVSAKHCKTTENLSQRFAGSFVNGRLARGRQSFRTSVECQSSFEVR